MDASLLDDFGVSQRFLNRKPSEANEHAATSASHHPPRSLRSERSSLTPDSRSYTAIELEDLDDDVSELSHQSTYEDYSTGPRARAQSSSEYGILPDERSSELRPLTSDAAELSGESHPHSSGRPISGIEDSSGSQEQEHEQEQKSQAMRREMFTPPWLYERTLFGFIALYVLLGITLAILYVISKRENGLSTTLSRNHYYWKYGPTAGKLLLIFSARTVFIIIASLWRQVDFWCKFLIPWQMMQKSSSSAENSVLLNYISPTFYDNLYYSAKRRHWIVFASVLVGLLLKAITVFSTGLLVLQATPMTKDFEFVQTNKFDPTNFNSTAVQQRINNEDKSPAFVYFGMVDQNLSAPVGTNLDMTYQSFEPKETMPINATSKVNVTALFPDFLCEEGSVNYTMPEDDGLVGGIEFHYNVEDQADNCTAGTNRYSSPFIDFGYDSSEPPPSRVVVTGVTRQWCSNAFEGQPSLWVLIVTDFRYNKSLDSSNQSTIGTGTAFTITAGLQLHEVSAIICRPKYTMGTVEVGAKNSTTFVSDLPAGIEEAMNINAVAASLDQTVYNNIALFGYAGFADPSLTALQGTDAWFDLMSVTNNRSDYAAFLDTDIMKANVRKVYQGVASQMASQYLLVPANDTTVGEVSYVEDRLHIQALSLTLMEICLALLLIATLVILWYRPSNVLPRDITTIGGFATLLAGSGSLQAVVGSDPNDTPSVLSQRVGQCNFWTSQGESDSNPRFFIDTSLSQITEQESSTQPLPTQRSPIKWWIPLPLTLPLQLLALSLPISCIIILEILQRKSENRAEGVSFINYNSDGTAQSLSVYIPTAVMIVIAMLYSSIEDCISILAPWVSLKAGSRDPRKGIMTSLHKKLFPFAVFEAVKYRHFAVVFAATAGLLGGLLTIAASGLYSIEDVYVLQSTHLQRSDVFDLSWTSSSTNDNHAALILSLIDNWNSSYSPFTYDELAFPKFEIPANITRTSDEVLGQRLNVQIPSLRARLNCSILDNSTVSIVNVTTRSGSPQVNLQAFVPLPPACQKGGQYGNESSLNFSLTFPFLTTSSGYTQNPTYIPSMFAGGFTDLHVGPFSETYFSDYAETNLGDQGDNPEGCPSIGYSFGEYNLNKSGTLPPSSFVCYQLIQEVTADVTFLLPSLTIDYANPPIPLESTAHYLTNGTADAFTRPYRPQSNIAAALEMFNFTSDAVEAGMNKETSTLDGIFSTILYGNEAIPGSDLIGPENTDRLQEAFQHVYARYMAQAISLNMRQPDLSTPSTARAIGDADTSTNFTGNLSIASQERLVQNKLSKIILQVLLGIMFLCGIGTFVVIGRKGLLIHNPSTIAGLASVLVGSNLCNRDIIPQGAEWITDKELCEVFAGLRLKLGWHDYSNGEQGTAREMKYGLYIGEKGVDDKSSWRLSG